MTDLTALNIQYELSLRDYLDAKIKRLDDKLTQYAVTAALHNWQAYLQEVAGQADDQRYLSHLRSARSACNYRLARLTA